MRHSSHVARSVFALVFVGSLAASCFRPDTFNGQVGECTFDSDCGQGDSCTVNRCKDNKCVEEQAPAGALANSPFEAPECHRFVCDGNGGEVLELDLSAKPSGNAGDCHRLDCDADGNAVTVVDATVLPANFTGDCAKGSCGADGTPMMEVDVTDVPEDSAGDCVKNTCDPQGMQTTVPADDPPTSVCKSYTCQDGLAVGTPANQGMSCAQHGLVCGANGECDACPAPDAMCTDSGPAAGSHTLAQAYNLGDIGWCDYNGYPLCGTLTAGQTSFFRYIGDGDGSFCSFDPYVRVQASSPVKLCEYFKSPSVSCPAGAMNATLDGNPGCCLTGSAPSMAIDPSLVDTDVFITVESQNASCVSYLLTFHT